VLEAIVAALAVVAAGPVATDDELAGARVITGFTGHHPPEGLRRMISDGKVAGVILFDQNAPNRSAV
jgi:hypothetical protein